MNKNRDIWVKLKEGLCQWAKLNAFLFICMLVIRLFFYFEVHTRIEIEASQFGNIMKGTVFDFYLLCHVVAWLSIPFLLFYYFFPKVTGKVYMGLVFFYVVVASILTEYYCNLSMPLDHVILVYTPEEVKGTATSSASITATPFLWFFGTIAGAVGLSLLWRKVKVGFKVALGCLLVALVVALIVPYKDVIREERYYKDHASFCLSVNQPSYTYVKMTDYIRSTKNIFENMDEEMMFRIRESATSYRQLHPGFEFGDPFYPFYRKFNDTDVLGPFLNQTTDSLPPDFVFIIVESLGQRLTGVETPTVSFTPFIDSLKQESLYWSNCLSSSERTFGVLPTIFASAPYGKYGFCVTSRPMPNHNSLLKDLENNGYGTSYYYGGVHSFDRFDGFLKANKVDFIYVPDMQMVDSATYEYLNEFNRWGLDDRETFQYVIDRKTKNPSPRPNIDIIMTLTTHEPFYFENVKEYEPKVVAMVEAHPEMSAKERNNIMKNQNVYACYLYMDECVRNFMEFYKTQPAYENTVFVITGDHRTGMLPFGDPIIKYNVPLLIYSPLLQRTKTMEAVVSHHDITPSFNAYLSAHYDYHIPDSCHWMGTSLDTVAEFRNTRSQAFMLNNRDVVDYINGEYMISNNRLFKLDHQMLTDQVDNPAKLKQLRSELDNFTLISQFAVQQDHLDPFGNQLQLLKAVNLDFESDYPQYFSKNVIKEEDNHWLIVDSTMTYGPLFENLVMTEDYDDVIVEMAFDLQSLDTTKELPAIAVTMGSYYMGLNLRSADDVSLNTGELEHYHYHLTMPIQEPCRGQTLKIYLHNNSANNMKYDNVKISVSAVAKP